MLEWLDNAKCAKDPAVQDELSRKIDRFHDLGEPDWVKEYCHTCPVRLDCLGHAMELLKNGDAHTTPEGIWGGLSRKERALLLNRQQKQEAKLRLLAEQMKAQFQDKSGPIAS